MARVTILQYFQASYRRSRRLVYGYEKSCESSVASYSATCFDFPVSCSLYLHTPLFNPRSFLSSIPSSCEIGRQVLKLIDQFQGIEGIWACIFIYYGPQAAESAAPCLPKQIGRKQYSHFRKSLGPSQSPSNRLVLFSRSRCGKKCYQSCSIAWRAIAN